MEATKVSPEGVRLLKIGPPHPVKVTALAYLREALLKGHYEDCPEAMRTAREFGATEDEIGILLEDPRRKPLSS